MSLSTALRFAPSPNGYLHLGHAFSALIGYRVSRELNGRFLVRIEDIDQDRTREEYIDAVFEGSASPGSQTSCVSHETSKPTAAPLTSCTRWGSFIRALQHDPKSPMPPQLADAHPSVIQTERSSIRACTAISSVRKLTGVWQPDSARPCASEWMQQLRSQRPGWAAAL
jgi:hypothetical protein